MRRRDFIAGLGGSAVWPRAARTQQQGLPVVGFLHFWASPNPSSRWLLEFRQGLADTGYVAGWNVAIEYRGANGQSAQLPALASELVRRDVAVIVASGFASPALLRWRPPRRLQSSLCMKVIVQRS